MEGKAQTLWSAGKAGIVVWAHSSIAVDDLEAAARFFEQAFGFEAFFVERGMSDQIAAITGERGMRCDLMQMRHAQFGHVLELIAFAPSAGLPTADTLPIRPGCSHLAFTVADLAGAKQVIEALGAVVLGEVTHFEDGPGLYARVPGGAFIELDQV